MSLASHAHLSGSGLFRLRLDTCVISISGVAGGVTKLGFPEPLSSLIETWNVLFESIHPWIYDLSLEILYGAGIDARFHFTWFKRWKYKMVTVRCLPSVLVILPSTLSPPPHPAHSWLLLLISRGSFPSSFMRIQADMMLFFLFSFAHKCMVNTLVWALLFPKRVAVTKSCVRFCVSWTILWALKLLSWL